MSIKRSELNDKWWFRLLKVVYWFLLIGNLITILITVIILLSEGSSFLSMISVFTAGVLFIALVYRMVAIGFIYIASGAIEVGFMSGEGKLLLISPKYKLAILWLIGICVVSGVISYLIADNNKSSNNNFIPITNTDVRNISILGSEIVEDIGLRFSTLEITNLGSFVTGDFGYNNWDGKDTSGNFMKVVFTITNTTKNSIYLNINSLSLIDQEGRSFAVDKYFTCEKPYTYENSPQAFSWDKNNLKPGIPCRVSALFEVSKNSKLFNLNLVWSK